MTNLIILPMNSACNETMPLWEIILIAVATVVVIVSLGLLGYWLLEKW